MSTHNQGSFFGARTAVDKAGGAPRRRRWAPKVRTGCLTCKIRRVKCDEARPSCEKCLSTGRKCDGYEDDEKYHGPVDSTNARAYRSRSRSRQLCNTDITNLHDASSTTFPSSPYCVSWIPFYGGELEKKNFDFFQSVTSSSLAGFHGSEFWARETLQVAHQYPALFHAITAFGSIHHCYLSDNTPCDVPRATTDNSRIEFGLREFNKAIKWMYKLIAQEDITFRDQQAILTTCILFTCLSTLQGRQLQAFMHVRNGIRLIHHWRLSHQHISEANRKIVNILLLTFIGLDTQIRPYISGQEALLHWGHEDIIVSSSSLSFDELQPFESLFEAYFELEVIFNRLLRLNFTEYLSDQWHLEIQLSVCQCDIWDARFSLLLSTMGYPTTASELGTSNFVRLRREYARFLMFPFTNPREESNVHDELSPLCLQILDLVQKVLENEPYSDTMTATSPNEREHHSKPHPIFVLGSTVLEILYVVATRSRDPSIRRQALHLMKLHPRREGICESMSGAKIVQWMIDIEEQGCPQFPLGGYSSFAPSSPDEESCPLPSSSNASIPASSSSCRGGCCGGNHASRDTSTVAVTSKIPCSVQGKWVCEIHRVVDTQYLLYTERQLKVVIWTLEDRILQRKGREMVVSWW